MAVAMRGIEISGGGAGGVAPHLPGRGGTGLRVAGPVRPVGERGSGRSATRPARRPAGAPPLRRAAARPGVRPVLLAGAAPRWDAGCGVGPARTVAVEAPLRLTRRGWCALTTLALGVAALVVLALSAVLGGDGGLELAGGSSVVVQPGDTVWSIAAAVADPGEDVRAVVDAIERLNDLDGAVVVPGQVLDVP